jgi:hypothetical protein
MERMGGRADFNSAPGAGFRAELRFAPSSQDAGA